MNEDMTLGDVLTEIETGKSFQTTEILARPDQLGVLKVSALSSSEFLPDEAKALAGDYTPAESHKVRREDLLISRANTRELVGAVVLVDRDYPNRLLSDKTLRLVIDENRADKSYLMLALRSAQARKHIEHFATGTSDSMRNISQDVIKATPLWLPNLTEQRRISASLKAQLTEVESARQAAQAQVREAGLLRGRVLKATFDGLTDAPLKHLGDWIASYRNGFGKRPGEGELGPIVLRIADVSSGVIDVSRPRRGAVSAREAETYKLRKNDLLFVRVNGAREIVGRCCVVGPGVPEDTIFNDHLIRVCLNPGIDADYARFCAGSPSARARIEEAASTSAGQLTISQDVIADISVPDMSLDDQRRIVTRLKAQLAEADAIAQAATAQLAEIERLPQRLLAQAFAAAA